MLNPSVGLIVSMSSPLNFFSIVVLPALSRPLSTAVKAKVLKAQYRILFTDVYSHCGLTFVLKRRANDALERSP